MSTIEADAERETAVIAEKISILQENMAKLDAAKRDQRREHERNLEELGAQLERAERKSVLHCANANSANGGANGGADEEQWFGCPVCLSLLRPPTRIFQCPEGHILCEECKENPAMVHCPQCRYSY